MADETDAIVVNTCGFVEDAKAESLDVRRALEAWVLLPPFVVLSAVFTGPGGVHFG